MAVAPRPPRLAALSGSRGRSGQGRGCAATGPPPGAAVHHLARLGRREADERDDPVGRADPGRESTLMTVSRSIAGCSTRDGWSVPAVPPSPARATAAGPPLDVGRLAIVVAAELLAPLPLHQVRRCRGRSRRAGRSWWRDHRRGRRCGTHPSAGHAGGGRLCRLRRTDPLCTFRVVRRDHAAFADGPVGRRVEAEARGALAARGRSPGCLRDLVRHPRAIVEGRPAASAARPASAGSPARCSEQQDHRWSAVRFRASRCVVDGGPRWHPRDDRDVHRGQAGARPGRSPGRRRTSSGWRPARESPVAAGDLPGPAPGRSRRRRLPPRNVLPRDARTPTRTTTPRVRWRPTRWPGHASQRYVRRGRRTSPRTGSWAGSVAWWPGPAWVAAGPRSGSIVAGAVLRQSAKA